MNANEALQLTQTVVALCPAQKITAATPAAWSLVLHDVSLPAALEAVRTVYRDLGNDQEFGARRIEADDILRQVRRDRAERIKAGPAYRPSSPDLTGAEQAEEMREHWRAVGDGRTSPYADDLAALENEPRRSITALVRRVGQV